MALQKTVSYRLVNMTISADVILPDWIAYEIRNLLDRSEVKGNPRYVIKGK